MFRVKLITALVMGATVWPSAAYAVSGPVAPVVPKVEVSAPAGSALLDARSSISRPVRAVRLGRLRVGRRGIGASVVLALVALASGMVLVAGRSRRRTPTT